MGTQVQTPGTAKNGMLARAARRMREDPIASVIALGLVGAGLVAGPGALRDYLRFPGTPLSTDVVGAWRAAQAGKQWVSISQGAWNVTQAFPRGVSCFVPATVTDGSLLVAEIEVAGSVAELPGATACDGVALGSLTGIVENVPDHLVSELVGRGLGAAATPTARLLHVPLAEGTNEKNDAFLGVLLCFIAAPLLALGVFPLRRAVGRFHFDNQERLRGAAFAADSPEANAVARRHGMLVAAFSGLAFAVGGNWLLWGILPVRVFAVGGFALGSFMMLLPNLYLRLHRRGGLGR